MNYAISILDLKKITDIGRRAKREFGWTAAQKEEMEQDLALAHINGCKLDFEALLTCDITALAHDLVGIKHHLDPETGQLRDHFRPKCALGEQS